MNVRHDISMSRENSNTQTRVLVTAASTRTGSINQALAEVITGHLAARGEDVDLVDLVDYPMPLYDGDLENREGIPDAAHRLVERISGAEVLVLVSPEYNGAFPPLLKNTVDWMTRVDTLAMAHLTVLLASASPAPSGGARGVEMVRQWMTNIGVRVAHRTLLVGSAALDGNGELREVDPGEVLEFVAGAIREQAPL
jgi:chromate reductase, NAD(P)H dehydrogenase (quinone)